MPTGVIPSTLIEAKLYRPQAGADLILRPQLLARLDAGLVAGRGHKLILVSAPAALADHAGQPVAGRLRPAGRLGYAGRGRQSPAALAALCLCGRAPLPSRCLPYAARAAGDDPFAARPGGRGRLLVEELSALPGELILVLDDYHRIHAHEVHQLLRQLLRYLPPRLHLVILTRTDPPLSGAAPRRRPDRRDPRR